MIRLGRDVWTLSDGFEACRFMVVSGLALAACSIAACRVLRSASVSDMVTELSV